MMALIRGLIGFIMAITLASFAVANRHNVEVWLSPMHPAFELPLYLVALGLMALGFVLGGVFVWLGGSPVRRSRRKQRRRIKALEKEVKAMKGKEDGAGHIPSEFFPSLPGASLPHDKNTAI